MLREVEAFSMPIREFCRKENITERTFFRLRYNGGMDVSEARCNQGV